MKKLNLFLIAAVFISVNANSQNVVNLGIKMIESDIFEAKRLLQWEEDGFEFYSFDELRALGFNPASTIIGTKGNNPTNALTFRVTAWGEELERSYTKEVVVVATPMYAKDIEPDLKKLGYVKVKEWEEQEYIHTYIHKTYQKKSGKYTNVVVVHFGKKSGCIGATFTKKSIPL